MSRLALMLASAAVLAVSAVGGAPASDGSQAPFVLKPRLAVLGTDPLTVRGYSFKARERITVTLDNGKRGTLRLRATRQGGFTALFKSVPIVRCHPLTIRAVGVLGSRAVRQVQSGPDCRMP